MRREVEVVILGIALHALYLLSIFDIYFKSPIVHGVDPVVPRMNAPAKRLVLFVADGLRADKFFELKPDGSPRAPFLHGVMHRRGKWGVSHARPPTESRPGHVAIIAGFYEDPSAVTKGWKANPVEFDSVFNRSQKVVAFGSPDIVPIFCGVLPHARHASYPHEYEDFAKDGSFLDAWVFDRFENMLNTTRSELGVEDALQSEGLVVFLHLLGCDTNGHAHRPFSSIYLNNVEVVDRGVERVYNLMEERFRDGKTAYVFTADHGMSDKGSHGDGEPANTETPLVAWGAGVQLPSFSSQEDDQDDGFRFVDEHRHHMATPDNWGLQKLERVDVNQGDIAPLMSTLLGLSSPLNSVGVLPTRYLSLSKAEEAEAVFANAKQILNQLVRKSQIKQTTSVFFKPFPPLADHLSILNIIQHRIDTKDYISSLELSRELIRLSLKGLHYFQTYDWWFLMSTITTGYLGWMIYVFLHLLKQYTKFSPTYRQRKRRSNTTVGVFFGMLSAVLAMFMFVQKSPTLYYLYVGMAIFFWERVCGETEILWRIFTSARKGALSKFEVLFTSLISFGILQLLVVSFFKREVYTAIFVAAGVVGPVIVSANVPGLSMMPAFVWAACWFLSSFTLMPSQIPEHTTLVVGSGLFIVVLAAVAWWFDNTSPKQPVLRLLTSSQTRQTNGRLVRGLYLVQASFVLLATVMVWNTTTFRSHKRHLPLSYQILNWLLAGTSMVLPLKAPPTILSRLLSIFLGFAPPFLLLSIGYEALFYSGLGLVLLSWIIVESTIAYSPFSRNVTTNSLPADERLIQYTKGDRGSSWRPVKLSDVHVALCFLVLINVAFFGTGNIASIASFEISSVYRFITIFNPFIMAGLLLFKLFIPFILVTCVFSIVVKIMKLPRLGCYFMVLILSDLMTICFFFLVRNSGSWMEIGNSISRFGIVSAQVVFVLLLLAVSNIFTKDVQLSAIQATKHF